MNDILEGKPALTRKIKENVAATEKKKKKAAAQQAVPNSEANRFNTARNQLRALAAVDEGVGQILQALEATGQLDNTLVIFTSDNGFFWREHGLSDKRWAYEESIRDPLLMRYPKLIKPGTVLEQLALSIDIAPTLLELAGTPIPESMQGKSLLSLFKQTNASWRNSFLTEYFQGRGFPRTPTWQAVRTDRWKYIHYTELEGMDELYDLKADPYELKNLIAEKSAQEPLKELKAELAKLLKEIQAR